MTFSNLATFRLTSQTALVIARGSVLDFESKHNAAIVNAANEGCLRGGGVDGAISKAGGDALFRARVALPIIEHGVRCLTGDAKLSGPGKFGKIKTNHVIHAVAPDYYDFLVGEYDEADELLKSAYKNSLDVADSAGLQEVAFSLLAAGIFKGKRSLKEVLGMGVVSICSWARDQPETTSVKYIVLCAFLEKEAKTLLQLAEDLGLEAVREDKEDSTAEDTGLETASESMEDASEENEESEADDMGMETSGEDGETAPNDEQNPTRSEKGK